MNLNNDKLQMRRAKGVEMKKEEETTKCWCGKIPQQNEYLFGQMGCECIIHACDHCDGMGNGKNKCVCNLSRHIQPEVKLMLNRAHINNQQQQQTDNISQS